MGQSRCRVFVAAIVGAIPATAVAQTPINAPGAMQPSTGTGVVHLMGLYREIGSDPTSNIAEGKEYILLSQIAYGVSKEFSLQLDVPLVYRDLRLGGPGPFDDDEGGFGDLTLLAKWRVFREDSGPTDTTRVSLAGGLQIPGNVEFEMDSSNDAWDPIIGAIFSTVRGRHGFNASAFWEFYTGSEDDQADSLRADVSYLFRLGPKQYTAETSGALYAVTELNGFHGTNGDTEVYFSPGIMFEAQTFTLDATVMIPFWQDVDERAESEFLIGLGVRLSF